MLCAQQQQLIFFYPFILSRGFIFHAVNFKCSTETVLEPNSGTGVRFEVRRILALDCLVLITQFGP